jgi:Bacterial regulatory proteins, lacI family
MNIRDIASAAHVSVATVSKVINHKDSEISNETRQRVLSVIKEYQYTPYANIQASFQTFHKQTIAFITEKILLFLNMYLTLKKMFPRQVILWSSVPLMRLLPTASANT